MGQKICDCCWLQGKQRQSLESGNTGHRVNNCCPVTVYDIKSFDIDFLVQMFYNRQRGAPSGKRRELLCIVFLIVQPFRELRAV